MEKLIIYIVQISEGFNLSKSEIINRTITKFMDIQNIKKIVNSNIDDESKAQMILFLMAEDEEIIPKILKILEEERLQNKALLISTNSELSRALVCLQSKGELPKSSFVIKEIKQHYIRWQHRIKCCFKIKGLP